MKYLLIFFISIKAIAYNDFYFVNEDPLQINIKPKIIKLRKNLTLRFMAKYKIKGRVLSSKIYNWDKLSSVATIDIGIGWGKLSRTNIFNQFEWDQSKRFLMFSIRKDKLNKIGTEKYIDSHLANIHLIPKDWKIDKKLRTINKYDIIEISGYLVDVQYDNYMYKTSISRFDKGAGACEIIYVNYINIINKKKKNAFEFNKPKTRLIDKYDFDFSYSEGTRN